MKHIRCTEHFILGTYDAFTSRVSTWTKCLKCADFFRFLSQKKYTELLNLLYKGSTLLLQRDQQGSGADLAILLIDVLTKSETKPCEEWIDKIAKLFEIMNASIPERETYLSNAVKWSMDNNKKGHPMLHKVS